MAGTGKHQDVAVMYNPFNEGGGQLIIAKYGVPL
jgi:hypothetical protein